MNHRLLAILCLLLLLEMPVYTQESMYFPPVMDNQWAQKSPESLGWCTEHIPELLQTMQDNGSKSIIVLYRGKIVIEEYFDGFHRDSSWVWFSAGKSLTSFLIGLARDQSLIDLDDSSRTYLGDGWSTLPDQQEEAIKVYHHLTMTTGLDYTVEDPFCTDQECLNYLNEPGTHWFYHNAPYSLLKDILETATGKNINVYTFTKLRQSTGIAGLWIPIGFNTFFFSTPRVMARFGLLMQNRGDWDGQSVLTDKSYFENMVSSSQDLNPAYGLLWWLNGKSHYKLPGSDVLFNGPIDSEGPENMYCAIGASGQLVCVLPDEELVIVRMGESTNSSLVPIDILHQFTGKLKKILCETSSTKNDKENMEELTVFPNPFSGTTLSIAGNTERIANVQLIGSGGKVCFSGSPDMLQHTALDLESGLYFIRLTGVDGALTYRKLIVP